jgi:hypothetical protein
MSSLNTYVGIILSVPICRMGFHPHVCMTMPYRSWLLLFITVQSILASYLALSFYFHVKGRESQEVSIVALELSPQFQLSLERPICNFLSLALLIFISLYASTPYWHRLLWVLQPQCVSNIALSSTVSIFVQNCLCRCRLSCSRGGACMLILLSGLTF